MRFARIVIEATNSHQRMCTSTKATGIARHVDARMPSRITTGSPENGDGRTPMDKAWKAQERAVAKLVGGRRFWANSGADVDVESGSLVVQVKNVKVCSLAALGKLALEAERQGNQRAGKIGIVAIKHRGGRGVKTPTLVVMTAAAFVAMSGPVPGAIVSEP
jgi:hypothetical protein